MRNLALSGEGFEVFNAVEFRVEVFWAVTPCSAVIEYQHFSRKYLWNATRRHSLVDLDLTVSRYILNIDCSGISSCFVCYGIICNTWTQFSLCSLYRFRTVPKTDWHSLLPFMYSCYESHFS